MLKVKSQFAMMKMGEWNMVENLVGEVGVKANKNTAARDTVPTKRKTPLKQGTVNQNKKLLNHSKLAAKRSTGLLPWFGCRLVSELDARRSINVTDVSLMPTSSHSTCPCGQYSG